MPDLQSIQEKAPIQGIGVREKELKLGRDNGMEIEANPRAGFLTWAGQLSLSTTTSDSNPAWLSHAMALSKLAANDSSSRHPQSSGVHSQQPHPQGITTHGRQAKELLI